MNTIDRPAPMDILLLQALRPQVLRGNEKFAVQEWTIEPANHEQSWSVVSIQIIQLVAVALLFLSYIYIVAHPQKRFRQLLQKYGTIRILSLISQLGIAALFITELEHGSTTYFGKDDGEGWLSASVLFASIAAAFANIISIMSDLPPTNRGIFDLMSCLLWTGSGFMKPNLHLPTQTTGLAEGAYAAAFMVDIFSSGASALSLPTTINGRTLFELATSSWMAPLLMAKEALKIENLSDFELSHRFAEQQDHLSHFSWSNKTLWQGCWGLLYRDHTRVLWLSAFLRLIADVSKMSTPWLLRALLQSPTSSTIALMFCSRCVGALCGSLSRFYVMKLGVQYKAVISSTLHAKTLRLDLQRIPNGYDIANLSEIDAQRLYQSAILVHDIWSFPLQVIVCVGGLCLLLPWESVICTLLVIAMTIPIMGIIGKRLSYWIAINMQAKDLRAQLASELLHGIKSIKMYAWESALAQRLQISRQNELSAAQSSAVVNAGLVSMMQAIPALLTLSSFGVMLWRHSDMFDGELIFASVMLFTMLNGSLGQVSSLVAAIASMESAMQRVRDYLRLPEASLQSCYTDTVPNCVETSGIQATEIDLAWADSPSLLHNSSFAFPKGKLSVLSAATGSGKTSFLLAMAGYLKPKKGSIMSNGSISYVSQETFLIRGSLRDNILFGRAFDARYYTQVVESCSLIPDFKILPHGDSTLITGNDTLSGGQRTRICLARAAYSQADIYIMDEPLANIDEKVQGQLIERLLGRNGLLRSATKVIASNSRQLLAEADAKFVLSDCMLKQIQDDELVIFDTEDEEGEAISAPDYSIGSTEIPPVPFMDSNTVVFAIEPEAGPEINSITATNQATKNPLVKHSSARKYFLYATVGGWPFCIALLILGRLYSLASTYALKIMASNNLSTAEAAWDLGIFSAFATAQTLLFFVFVAMVFRLCIIPTAAKLHDLFINSVLAQPMAFFEATEAGDILNLITNDMNHLDMSLSGSLISLIGQYINLAISCGVLVQSAPMSIIVLVPLAFISSRIQNLYVPKLKELRHLEAKSRAPLISSISEASKGRVHFTVYGFIDQRLQNYTYLLERNLRALLPLACVDLWLGVRLELVSVTLQALAVSMLLSSHVDLNTLGFAMTYVFQVTATLSTLAQMSAQFEIDLVSFSRIEVHINQQDPVFSAGTSPIQGTPPPANWPSHGQIEFNSYSARYAPDIPPSLHSLNIKIIPGERVAIVGRTGAGKSSLVLALLGLLYEDEGSQILIDGVDIATLDQTLFRRSISIIPQDPIVFSCTLRENLDPFGLYSDEEILCALHDCTIDIALLNMQSSEGVEEANNANNSILDINLGHDGKSARLSTGQIQLLAIARAMLIRSKVIILDEATSGVDAPTVIAIHHLLQRHFVDTTNIFITHQLEMTVEYDKVLVVDTGRVVAFDTPMSLVKTDNRAYTSMLEDAGLLDYAKSRLKLNGTA